MTKISVFTVFKNKSGSGGGTTGAPGFFLIFGPGGTYVPQQNFVIKMRGFGGSASDDDVVVGCGDNQNFVIARSTNLSQYDEWRNISVVRNLSAHNTTFRWNGIDADIIPYGSSLPISVPLGNSTGTGGGLGSTDNFSIFGNVVAKCDIAEVIVYDTVLSHADRLAIEEYLGYKYNLIVPVELVSFAATIQGNSINLTWATATELNNHGFELFRNGNKIAFVAGKGTTTEKQEYLYDDINLQSGIYNYRLEQLDFDGTRSISAEITVLLTIPETFILEQNYPNPFNPSTRISYQLPVSGNVTLKVYDLLGREVATLVNEDKPAGTYEVAFDASQLSSGVYLYRLGSGSFIETKKMTIIK